MKNIVYKSDQIEKYFSKNRIVWEDFYESERRIITALDLNSGSKVLDIGCGCGGLGIAIKNKFGVSDYVGIEINAVAAETGKRLNPLANIYSGDFVDISNLELQSKEFDVVFSLSCFDWNIQFSKMLDMAWKHVAPGGSLVLTLRLTKEASCTDMNISYQYINYEGLRLGERAAYVVLNAAQLFRDLTLLEPSKIKGYGY